MTQLILSFFSDTINSFLESMDSGMVWMLQSLLEVENLFANVGAYIITAESIKSVYDFIYLLACSLAALKFLTKGFKVYVLWRDGDEDASPQSMLVGAATAVVVMAAFPYVYSLITETTVWVAESILERLGAATSLSIVSIIANGSVASAGIVSVLLLLVYLVMYLVMCVKLIQRGLELLILRFGVPLACLGLIDSDSGVFKPYMQALTKALLTSMVQIICLALSLRMIIQMNFTAMLLGCAMLSMAFATPTMLSQILLPTGGGRGGNIAQKAGGAVRAVSTVSKLIGGG